ncbi:MAG: patatin-like phospholipase family protein [Candidatus Dormibacteraeota bacterium]|nr:patatin-like phospholipase family protein [Candidatus Dormibacteraeota bacterium]
MARKASGRAPRASGVVAPPEKRALVLCGGGITGLTYEIGALRALDDLLVGVSVNDFDVYVGTSAGSLVGALLANGVTPTEMALGLEGSNRRLRPPTRWTIYRPNVAELAGRALKLPELLREIAWEVLRHPSRLNPLDIAGMLSPLLPSGFFSNHELLRYLEELFAGEGLVNDFRSLEKELHIVSCAIDTGQRVVFSPFRNEHVPISDAVAASSAIPMLFKPVRIDDVDYVDGGIKGISALDVAVDRGATLIVVINPVVPIDTRHLDAPELVRGQIGDHLRDGGMRAIYNQVMRGMLHDGMLDHIRLVRNRKPDVDIVLIEPRADDDKMFFHELMSFSARLMVMQHGYESVSNGLHETWGYLRHILPKHGVHITRRVIDRKPSDVPAESIESTSLLRRMLRQTVLARRPRFQVVEDTDVA